MRVCSFQESVCKINGQMPKAEHDVAQQKRNWAVARRREESVIYEEERNGLLDARECFCHNPFVVSVSYVFAQVFGHLSPPALPSFAVVRRAKTGALLIACLTVPQPSAF